MKKIKLIKAFVHQLITRGVSKFRVLHYIQTLRVIHRWKNKPFKEWTEQDLEDILFEIEKKGYKPHTINEFKKVFECSSAGFMEKNGLA